jgi:hypothetical protein
MANFRYTLWIPVFLAPPLVPACDRQDAESGQGTDNSAIEARLQCTRRAGDAMAHLRESMKSVPVSVAVMVERRNHEQICLQEAACLEIEEARLGPFLQKCLDAAEQGN